MSQDIMFGVFDWFFSCPSVISACLIFASFIGCVFALIGYAKREV